MGANSASPDDELAGLVWAKCKAPSPFMREVAALALEQRETLGSLARQLGVKHTSTVSGHFQAERPRGETVQRYQRAVRISNEYRALLEGQPLSDSSLRNIEFTIENRLRSLCEVEATDLIREAFEREPELRRRALEAYRLESHRLEARIGGSVEVGGGLRVSNAVARFFDVVKPAVDLVPLIRKQQAADGVLSTVAMAVNNACTAQQRDAVIEVVRAFLKANNHDLTVAENELNATLASIKSLRMGP